MELLYTLISMQDWDMELIEALFGTVENCCFKDHYIRQNYTSYSAQIKTNIYCVDEYIYKNLTIYIYIDLIYNININIIQLYE